MSDEKKHPALKTVNLGHLKEPRLLENECGYVAKFEANNWKPWYKVNHAKHASSTLTHACAHCDLRMGSKDGEKQKTGICIG